MEPLRPWAHRQVLKALRWVELRTPGRGPLPDFVRRQGQRAARRALAARIESLEAEMRRTPEPLPAASDRGNGVRPLISVILPTFNRASSLAAAIDSVIAQTYDHWELLVSDDGSTDDTTALVDRYRTRDARVQFLAGERGGAAAARNRALARSRGEILAYLDSDNWWYPDFLATVAGVLDAHPERDSVYLALLIVNREAAHAAVRCPPYDAGMLEQQNFIDLNVFAHRRRLFETNGGFDERLTRLIDWDLIRRYCRDSEPLRVPVLGCRYENQAPDSTSVNENLGYNDYLVRAKWQRPVSLPVRVLYALWHYPQLSESYIRWEIAYVRSRGVEVEVWSELEKTPAPFSTDVPIHHGGLADAIRRVRPDVVHVHWSSRGEAYLPILRAAGVPMTVRDHGFDFSPALVERLLRSPVVRFAYVFPHLAAQLRPSAKLRPLPVAFNPGVFPPAREKDRRLVLRTGAALPTKDFETFFEAARRCPEHRFVLVLVVCADREREAEELRSMHRSFGSPVDLRFNLQADEVADLTRQAGTYLHTHGLTQPFGMSISIAEAMATGCWILGRRCPPAAEYIGDAGLLYGDVDEAAALVRQTLDWTDGDWKHAWRRSIDRAYANFADLRILPVLVDDWTAIAAARQADGGLAIPAPQASSAEWSIRARRST